MARKKKPADGTFILYDVFYQDGSRTSNRKIASAELDPFDSEGSVRAVIEQQDRKIAAMSGMNRGPIKSIVRSGQSAGSDAGHHGR